MAPDLHVTLACRRPREKIYALEQGVFPELLLYGRDGLLTASFVGKSVRVREESG